MRNKTYHAVAGTFDAIAAECVTTWRGLRLVENQIAYRALQRVAQTS